MDDRVREAAQRVYVAALRRAYTEEASGDRETPGDSASLDYAHYEWNDALDAYAAARAASGGRTPGVETVDRPPASGQREEGWRGSAPAG